METRLCSVCFNETTVDPCAICADETRDKQIIAVVERPSAVLLMESEGFKGRYHVLHGVISPRDGIGPDQLRIRELVDRLWDQAIDELLVCLPGTQEGNATAMSIEQELSRARLPGIKLTRLMRGRGGSLSSRDLEW